MIKKIEAFFIMELAVGLAIITFLAMLTLVPYGFIKKSLVKVELDKLYATFLYAQQCALVEGKEQTLIFDQTNHRYRYQEQWHRLPSSMSFGLYPCVYGPPSAPKHELKKAITFENDRVSFYPDGVITPGMVNITDVGKQYMYSLTVDISSASFIRRYCYDGTWVLLS